MLDFNLVKKTNLRQKGELDRLFGVSRIMVNRYLSGESLPRGANRKHISKTISILAEYVENGTLPFAVDVDQSFRQQVLDAIHAKATVEQ